MIIKRPEKFVIGLTGNIGTGKSVVRRMLEHLGAYGIDADLVGHEAFEQGSSSYERVIKLFGLEILTDAGAIDRKKLGKIVFSSPEKLVGLENIVHPYVGNKIGEIISNTQSPVVVLEAIKLLESGLGEICDSLWVTHTPEEQQVQRLVEKRKMTLHDAHRRVYLQSPQAGKMNRADIVIHTSHSFINTWEQISAGWDQCVPQWARDRVKRYELPGAAHPDFLVIQADPAYSERIMEFFQEMLPDHVSISVEGITSLFAENKFLLLFESGKIAGSLEFQAENHISKTMRIVLDNKIPTRLGLNLLVKQMEKISQEYYCQVVFILPGYPLAPFEEIWHEFGYQRVKGKVLSKDSWQQTAMELIKLDSGLLFRILG